MPPGLIPVPCSVALPFEARRLQRGDAGRVGGIDPTDRGDDVLARLEQLDDVTRARHHRRVDDGVGVERADLVEAVRRLDADRSDVADLADVAAHLVVAVHPTADELQLGMGEDALDRLLAEESGCPLNDAICHAMILSDDARVARLARVAHGIRPPGHPARPPARHGAASASGTCSTPRRRDRSRVVSMCAGEGRDLLGVLEDHPAPRRRTRPTRRARPGARGDRSRPRTRGDRGVVRRRGHEPRRTRARCQPISSSCAACSATSPTPTSRTRSTSLPTLCAPGAVVIWTRHRRPPDATPAIRARSSPRTGSTELAFHTPEGTMFCVGMNRLTAPPAPFRPDARLFDFVGYKVIEGACPQCGFSYRVGRRRDHTVAALRRARVRRQARRRSTTPRRGPDPSPRCGRRSNTRATCATCSGADRTRLLAQREVDPVFVPMGRDERVVEDRYNEQDPGVVAAQLLDAAETFAVVARQPRRDRLGTNRHVQLPRTRAAHRRVDCDPHDARTPPPPRRSEMKS